MNSSSSLDAMRSQPITSALIESSGAPAERSLGVTLSPAVRADTVIGDQASTYRLNPAGNPFYIGRTTTIATTSGDGVYGASGTSWTLANAGTITASAGYGVHMEAAAYVSNRGGGDISADTGIYITGGSGTVTNGGDITATIGGGIVLAEGGQATNYGPGNISGLNGINIQGATGSVFNGGHVTGVGNDGVALGAGGSLTNWADGNIAGHAYGVFTAMAPGSVTNGGVISAADGPAVRMAEGGNATNWASGNIYGGTGVYVTGGTSAVTNDGKIGGSGGAGVLLGDGGSLFNAALADISGQNGLHIAHAFGSVVNAGAIAGTTQSGVVFAAGGTIRNDAGATISGDTYGAVIFGGFGTIVNDGAISASGNLSTGVILGAGGGDVTNASGASISATYGVFLKQAGAVTNAGTIDGSFGSVSFAGAGANTLTLQTGSTLVGAAVGATASGSTNALVLQGNGVADNRFFNFNTLTMQGSGTWTLDGASTFGTATVSSGTLEVGDSTDTGDLVVNSGLTNNAVIGVAAGTADIIGAVTGSGSATIAGGTLEFGSSFIQNVSFTGSTGKLALADSQAYTGTISGFSKTGGTSLDLGDISFVSGTTKATFAENGAGTGGVLTVTDGTRTANVDLAGNYAGSTFTTSSDKDGGTIVVDPHENTTASRPAAVLPFIAAMAGFESGRGHFVPTADATLSASTLLAVGHAVR
jgi:hypothetical protein